MKEHQGQLTKTLASLGFSEIEALVYLFLLSESPVTGYRVSHGIGKPTANTYKAISALQEKGAVLIDDGARRLVRAVPPRELLTRLERNFSRQCSNAEEVLSSIGKETSDDRIWHLASSEQVFERARTMIAEAKDIILADIFPDQMRELRDAFNAAADRGLIVYVIVYEPVPDARFDTVARPGALETLAWPGDQLNLVTDASQHLLCMFNRQSGAIHQAVWSNSPYLSCIQHNHLSMEVAIKSLTPQEQDRLVYGGELRKILLSEARPEGLKRMIASIEVASSN
jgi:sugar-specific transcriptional regulator TrmB